MDFELNAPIVRALIYRLQQELPAEIAARKAAAPAGEVVDQRVFDPPAQYLPFAPPAEFLTVFPTIGILDADSLIVDDTGSSATGMHDLGVIVYLATPEHQSLAWGLRHYLGAISQVVMRSRVLLDQGGNTASWGVTATRIVPGDTLQDENDARTFMSWAVFIARFRREEVT